MDAIIVEPQPAPGPSEHTDAFLALSHTLARHPDQAVQRLVETAMKLTAAGSAGVTLEDDGDPEVLRWIATTGELGPMLGGTLPRGDSPCGTVLQRGRTLVMCEPARHYRAVEQIPFPIHEALLAPFARRGRLVGTVWVLAHQPGKRFTTADVQVVEGLTTFAAALLDSEPKPRRRGARPATN